MATFISISGPSSTGKTSIVDDLVTRKEFSNIACYPDLLNTVWRDLVMKGFFSEYSEIASDPEYICVYLLKMIEYYKNLIEDNREKEGIILLDCCWLDLAVYGLINMWCNHTIKDLQSDILCKINGFKDSVSRIYMTTYDDTKRVVKKGHSPYKIYSKKVDAKLELSYYELFKDQKYIVEIPTSDTTGASLFILEDMKNLGYL